MQEEARTEPTTARSGWSWAKLLKWSALSAFVVMALITIFAGVIPPLIVFAVLWLVGALLLGRATRGAAILLLIVSVAFMITSAPFVIPTLVVPASAGDFILNVASYVAAALATIAAIAVLRRRDGSDTGAPRKAWLAGIALTLLAVVVGVVAMLTFEDATLEDGDIELVAENVEFSEDSISSDGGTVAVFVDNKDGTLHTFTIDDLDVNLDIPAGSKARIEFEAEPGTYEFYCVPHQDAMKGELEVG